MFKFKKHKIKNHYSKFLQVKKNKIKNIIIKFCVFAGRKDNMIILNNYIKILLDENIINEYHIFDFTRNLTDKKILCNSYQDLLKIYPSRIFIHNQQNENNNNKNQYNWAPFYQTISNKKFYKNSVIIKCDDDILFIDVKGFKNAIKERINDKKSFIIHSNCINNNICTYFQKNLYPSIKNNLDIYPKGGIMGPCFNNPIYAFIMQHQFLNDCKNNLNNIYNYYLKDYYINTRISINFILINGNDCRYFKNTSINDEYEVSSYYPEKLDRPNRIIGNFVTSHYSYSLQEKILSRKKDLKNLYNEFSKYYINNYKKLDFNYINDFGNKYRVNKIGKNKYYIKKFLNNTYFIKNNENKYLYTSYINDQIKLSDKKRTYFDIKLINHDKIIINLGIYRINRYNILNEFKNRNLFLKLMNDYNENLIQLEKSNNYYYMKFAKSKLYINSENNIIKLDNTPITKWYIGKYKNNKKMYFKKFHKNKKFYYRNLNNNNIFTNFYLGWGNEKIIKTK